MVKEVNKDIRIVILQRGWVFVGNYEKLENGECILTSASCIRRWGTTKGLGELVDGPTTKTILDLVGVVKFNELTVVASIECRGEKWLKICA